MDYIAEKLRALAVPIADLHEDPANARKGPTSDVTDPMHSLKVKPSDRQDCIGEL